MALIRSFPITLLLCISLIAAAPLPCQNPSLWHTPARRKEELSFLEERSFYDLWDRDIEDKTLFSRDKLVPSAEHVEQFTLVRRESIAAKIRNAFKKAGEGIKKGFQKVGEGIKTAAKKVGEGVKTAAKKVGEFAKDTGAKIAKVGLEVISTAQSIGAKVAKFIPGVGKPISAALTGMSKATALASDKIPAKLGGKLKEGIEIMKKIQNPVAGPAGAAINALRRDIHRRRFGHDT